MSYILKLYKREGSSLRKSFRRLNGQGSFNKQKRHYEHECNIDCSRGGGWLGQEKIVLKQKSGNSPTTSLRDIPEWRC